MENKSVVKRNSYFPYLKIRDSLLALVYPQPCAICKNNVESQDEGAVCGDCWRATRVFNGCEILCEKCGAFLKSGITEFQTFCRRCKTDNYDAARAVGLYDKALLNSVLNLKREPFIPPLLRRLIISAFYNSPFTDASVLIPIPLSKRRFLKRGFNQASVIARIIAQETGIPIDEISLKRKFHTEKHRAGMDRKARSESVRDAFEIVRSRLVAGQKVLLVDDVFTSGATASTAAKTLKEHGAVTVNVLTIARAF